MTTDRFLSRICIILSTYSKASAKASDRHIEEYKEIQIFSFGVEPTFILRGALFSYNASVSFLF